MVMSIPIGHCMRLDDRSAVRDSGSVLLAITLYVRMYLPEVQNTTEASNARSRSPRHLCGKWSLCSSMNSFSAIKSSMGSSMLQGADVNANRGMILLLKLTLYTESIRCRTL